MKKKYLSASLLGVVISIIYLSLSNYYPNLRNHSLSAENSRPMSYHFAVQRAAPSVVNVYNRSFAQDDNPNSLTIHSLGSGVVMDDKGYIVTNKHVVDNADQIIIALQDGRIYQAQLIGSDSLTDLAILKIDAQHLPVIPINDQRTPQVGDIVLAIGNPYNIGQTITQGIISATGRSGLSPSGRQNFIQTDASINQGNSGGALINSQGELVGINTLSFDKTDDGAMPEGIGLAIPTGLVEKIMTKLIRDGRVIRGYIGIGGQELAPRNNDIFKKIEGIMVSSLAADGPAAKAGIQLSDIIINVNNQAATSPLQVMDQIAEIRPGTVIPIVVLRHDKPITLQVTVEEYPQN